MRFTSRLCAQHLGWTFKKHWQVQGRRIPNDTGATNELENVGILVKDPIVVIKDHVERTRFGGTSSALPVAKDDVSHPQGQAQKCYVYGNANVLLEGMQQAQVLTKTVKVSGLPKDLFTNIQNTPSSIDRYVQQMILASNVFDSEQVLLPKVKSPDRPAYNFPREYGISHHRRNRLLVNRLLMECEKSANHTFTSRRRMLDQADFRVTIPKDEELFQLNVRIDKMVTANKPIEPIKGIFGSDIPDLYPVKSTISLPKLNVYTTESSFPLSNRLSSSHPHTIFTYFNKEFVGNMHGTGVSTTQFHSRTLLNAFTVAAARAKQLYGDSCLTQIPKPIVVQSVQTDGRTFHFGVFQLNTMELGENGVLKNYWFHEENMDLYAQCGYKYGQPYLEGYDKNVYRYLNAFYHNA